RYYHPALQRFISEDPVGFGGGDTNLYAFVSNSPTAGRDPLGLQVPPPQGIGLDQGRGFDPRFFRFRLGLPREREEERRRQKEYLDVAGVVLFWGAEVFAACLLPHTPLFVTAEVILLATHARDLLTLFERAWGHLLA